jgi:hypothetical protein
VPAVPAVPAFGQLKHSVPNFMPARGVVFCVEMACLLGPTLGIVRSWVQMVEMSFFSPLSFFCAAARRQLFLSSGFTGTVPVINNHLDYEGGISSTNPAVHVMVITAFLVFLCQPSYDSLDFAVCAVCRVVLFRFRFVRLPHLKVQTVRDHGLDRCQIIHPFVIGTTTIIMFTPSRHDMEWK